MSFPVINYRIPFFLPVSYTEKQMLPSDFREDDIYTKSDIFISPITPLYIKRGEHKIGCKGLY